MYLAKSNLLIKGDEWALKRNMNEWMRERDALVGYFLGGWESLWDGFGAGLDGYVLNRLYTIVW